MNISDLGAIKKMLMGDLAKEDQKPQDEFREGVQVGITMALLKIDRLMESESERMAREYGEDQDR